MAYINVTPEPDNSFSKGYLVSTLLGVVQTTKVFFKQILKLEESATVQWPEVEFKYSERFKGAHFLTKRPDGQVRCTACFLCATNCPAQCITIEAGQSPDGGIEKFPVRFEFIRTSCAFLTFMISRPKVSSTRSLRFLAFFKTKPPIRPPEEFLFIPHVNSEE